MTVMDHGDEENSSFHSTDDYLRNHGKVLGVKFDAKSENVRKIYFAEHKVPSRTACKEKPVGRTLILSKIPGWATPDSIKRVFEAHCGSVRAVYFNKKPFAGSPAALDASVWPEVDVAGCRIRGFKYGHVVFEKSSSMKHALKRMDSTEPVVLSTPEHPVVTGLKKWKREYNQDLLNDQEKADKLIAGIKSYVEDYDERRQRLKRKADEEAEADDEGWVTVSRHATNTRKPVGNVTAKGQAKVKARDAKRRKRMELMNFYKFQMKEEKLDRIKELKEKFETDKEKQLKMQQDRQQRKFKSS